MRDCSRWCIYQESGLEAFYQIWLFLYSVNVAQDTNQSEERPLVGRNLELEVPLHISLVNTQPTSQPLVSLIVEIVEN